MEESYNKEKKNNKALIIIVSVVLFLLALGGVLALHKDKVMKLLGKDNETSEVGNNGNNTEVIETPSTIKKSEYTITKNSLDTFDLAFLKLEGDGKNMIYSPLSIKYALGMLMQGANNETKNQINTVLGNYKFHKYTNNSNMSFANALFIKNTYKDSIKKSYVDLLANSFDADVKYDSFSSPNNINKYVSNKTFKLINNLVGDVKNDDYVLINALAIDMNWVRRIQADSSSDDTEDIFGEDDIDYSVGFSHLDYHKYIAPLGETDFHKLIFNNDTTKRQSVEIGAVINNYDIVKILGKDKIKETVMNEYNKWLDSGAPNACDECTWDDEDEEAESSCKVDTSFDFEEYLKELDSNYGFVEGSTDFELYVDDNVKVFKKDLRKYGDTQLQYIGIMPRKEELTSFISKLTASDINNLINSTKEIKSENFKDGVITEIYGYIPLFKFDYELNLKDDLKKIGITDIFDSEKADLSNLTTNKSYISNTLHKATIEFTNNGIKAGAGTAVGGRGGGDCGFDYLFNPPVEKINMTFNKPFLFLIVDKDTEEVWFTGTVYEPDEYKSYYDLYNVNAH